MRRVTTTTPPRALLTIRGARGDQVAIARLSRERGACQGRAAGFPSWPSPAARPWPTCEHRLDPPALSPSSSTRISSPAAHSRCAGSRGCGCSHPLTASSRGRRLRAKRDRLTRSETPKHARADGERRVAEYRAEGGKGRSHAKGRRLDVPSKQKGRHYRGTRRCPLSWRRASGTGAAHTPLSRSIKVTSCAHEREH